MTLHCHLWLKQAPVGDSRSERVTSLLLAASAKASCAENVLLPTPPLPDNTSILCLILRMRCSMASKSGSGPFGAVAQISWFGQPAHAADFPAVSLLVPGQSAVSR